MGVTSITQGTAIAIGLFLLFGVALPGLLVWRDVRRERRLLASPIQPDATADFSSYLEAVSKRLGFVPEQNDEICAEIEAHLHDASDAMVLDGLDPATAKQRAMAQLGSPADLAFALRDARQDRRPVLAVVGGGALEAGKGLVTGWFLGGFLLFGASTLVIAAFGLLEAAGALGSDDAVMSVMRSALLVPAVCAGLAVGSQRGVLAVAGASRRSVSSIARAWAIVGAALVAWLTIFVVEDDMAWLEAVARLAMPLAVTVGALHVGKRWLPASGKHRLMGSVGIVGVLAVLPFVAAPPQARYGPEPSGLAVLPAQAPAGSVPTDGIKTGLYASCDEREGRVECDFYQGDRTPPLAPSWRDLRLEAWPATLDGNWPASGVDPAARRPAVVIPVDGSRRRLTATIDIGERRDGPGWWLVLTGLHTDGQRYRLTDGEGEVLPFVGTVADWLNAPG